MKFLPCLSMSGVFNAEAGFGNRQMVRMKRVEFSAGSRKFGG
jgi:hypothetical protein